MPIDGVVFATCISAAAATLVMGLYANYPIALAPGMSLNAYFTYVVCLGMHVPWRTALGVIFLSGRGVPDSDRHPRARADRQRNSGLPEAFDRGRDRNVHRVRRIAECESGGGESGDIRQSGHRLRNHEAQLACVGLAIMLILMTRKVTGAILIGVLATTLFGILRGMSSWPTAVFSLPHPSSTWLQLDLRERLHLGLFEIIFVFLFVDLVRQRGHAGRSVRAGRIRERRENSARGPSVDFGCGWHDLRSAHRNVDGNQLHRERGGSRGRRADWAQQHLRRGIIFAGGVLRAAGGSDSRICDCASADSSWAR